MTTQIINELAVEISGQGPPTLCVHGLGGSSNSWTPLLPALENRLVVRPDLPGSGSSPAIHATLSIPDFVEALLRLADALNYNEFDVVAHSMGTILAMHLATLYPSRVRSLALFGPLAAPPDSVRPAITARAEAAKSGVVAMHSIADRLVATSLSATTRAINPLAATLLRESVMHQSPLGYSLTCAALAQAIAAPIESIAVPTLLIVGAEDVVAPPENVRKLHAAIKLSRFVEIPACGHNPMIENSDRCIAELSSFYANT